MKINRTSFGFTMIELVIILTLLGALYGLISINLLGSSQKATLASTVDVFISDVRSQQLKAMLGDTEGRQRADAYGVLLLQDKYILFHGPSYSPADPANYTVTLPANIFIQQTLFPNGELIFASGSGEIVNYSPAANSLIIKNITNADQRLIKFNRFGTVIYEN
jgi:type II secretory pathway pseudopilin PulG